MSTTLQVFFKCFFLFQLKDGELDEVRLSKAIESDLNQREKQVNKNKIRSFIADCRAKGKGTFPISHSA